MSKSNKPTCGLCRDCGNRDNVPANDWYRASKARCSACGGMMDRIAGSCGKHKPKHRKKVRPNKYPSAWRRIRTNALHRANHKCFLCKKTEKQEIDEIGRSLSVHHINGLKYDCNRNNLIVLCKSCHASRIHQFSKKVWRKPAFPKMARIEEIKDKPDTIEQREFYAEEQNEDEYNQLYGDPCAFLR